jgi:hypothetical protein
VRSVERRHLKRQPSPEVVFRFRRPSGSPAGNPSTAMTEALRQLGQAREMEPLLRKAREAGRHVVIEVFQSKDGQPLLIHPALLPEKVA